MELPLIGGFLISLRTGLLSFCGGAFWIAQVTLAKLIKAC